MKKLTLQSILRPFRVKPSPSAMKLVLRGTRVNRNGIPILDPPGRNGIASRPAVKCDPGAHWWVPTDKTDLSFTGEQLRLFQCKRCPEDDWRLE